jgi:hypothetical protein
MYYHIMGAAGTFPEQHMKVAYTASVWARLGLQYRIPSKDGHDYHQFTDKEPEH